MQAYRECTRPGDQTCCGQGDPIEVEGVIGYSHGPYLDTFVGGSRHPGSDTGPGTFDRGCQVGDSGRGVGVGGR